MRPIPLQTAVVPLFLCRLLSVLSITPQIAGSDGMSHTSVKNGGSANNSVISLNLTVPSVKGGGKTVVTYNGDSTALKCDSSTYNPVEWLWYKVNGSEMVPLNMSAEHPSYKQDNTRANETKLHISNLTEGDAGFYVCRAVFQLGDSDGRFEINVLSLMVPFKVFLGILVEVVVLVAVILGYELISKRKHREYDVKSEDEQMAQLKSEENGTSEGSTTRQRKT